LRLYLNDEIPISGFSAGALAFMRGLKRNNRAKWFAAAQR